MALPRLLATPHPSLLYYPSFFSQREQTTLLSASLALLSSPALTNSDTRSTYRRWTKANPADVEPGSFPPDEAFLFEKRHFDGVIEGYRETLLRKGSWKGDDLGAALQRLYALLPPSTSSDAKPLRRDPLENDDEPGPADPPPHLIAHLIHLSSRGAIYPHVDNMEAFGTTIVGASLGGARVLRFKKAVPREGAEDVVVDGPEEFEILAEPGSVYIQKEPLRTYYEHEVLERAQWEGKEVGGTQRLSIMLRDRLPQ